MNYYSKTNNNISNNLAMCLGGPNFDPLSMNEDKLRAQGLTEDDIKVANEALCLNVFSGGPKTYQKHPTLGRIPWSDEGYSERILKRKLIVDKISLNHGTLIMHPFFLVVTRDPKKPSCGPLSQEDKPAWNKAMESCTLSPFCNFLSPDNHIGWIRTRQSVSHGQYFGCRNFFDEIDRLHLLKYSPCTKNNDGSYIGSSEECLLDKSWSDWNFMPFRIKFKALKNNLCLSQFVNGSLSFLKCSNFHIHSEIPNINISYTAPQLFHFFPLKKTPKLSRI